MAVKKSRIGAHAGRRIAHGDSRSPMRRLLEDNASTGRVEVAYDQQWRTFFKAITLGLLEEDGTITDEGKAFLNSERP